MLENTLPTAASPAPTTPEPTANYTDSQASTRYPPLQYEGGRGGGRNESRELQMHGCHQYNTRLIVVWKSEETRRSSSSPS
ncbi:unnamed protein product [Boreogadus saida]